MHADGDWQTVEGVLTKDMTTVGEYLQTWKLKLSTTKTVLAAFHLNNKEAKHELQVKYNNETQPSLLSPNTGCSHIADTLSQFVRNRHHTSRS